MKYCSNCGNKIEDGVKFCPSCGNSATAGDTPTKSTTGGYDKNDIEQNKAMGVLAYLGILVLIPILAAKESKFARFHANQGLILCIAAILYGVAYSVLTSIILAISWRLYFLVSILGFVGIVFAVLCVIGIINVVNGQAKELPVIGKYRILR
ncbi:MAG: zinc-ribbon domain-containing protein [Muribaculaceae bacterium]|nr:zinc-ribbon domain-containing protein [Muribaculaceae bacterium]